MRARSVNVVRRVACVLSLGVLGSLGVSPLADPEPAAALTAEAVALAQAVATGDPVEVPSERAEYSEVRAMPDGRMRMDMTVSPVWARGDDGAWHRPDPTLEVKADGSIGPRFDVAGTRFSGGGIGPMARLSRAGTRLAFSWPGGVLPTPSISGTQATYANAWPGVDLVLDAATDGFRPVLVVKTPEAARLPQLTSVTFPVTSAGATLRPNDADGFEFVDPAGSVIFSGPAGAMWDSAGDARTQTPTPAGEALVPGRKAAAGGDRVKRVPAAATSKGLTISADPAWLTAAERKFPLFVDPVAGAGTPTYTMVSSGGWEAWKFSGDEGVGECDTWQGYYCGENFVKRIFFQYSTAQANALAGKEVMDATFRAYETWSFQCSPRWINLYRVSGTISSGTAWPGPATTDLLGDRLVSAGREGACSPAQPNAWVDFNDNPDETNENLKATVQAWVAGNYDLTMRLSAADENDTSAHKRFEGFSASLQVYYRPVPVTPTPFGVQTGTTTATSCGSSTAPSIVDTPTATFRGTVQSEVNGEPAVALRLRVGYQVLNADNTWSTENLYTTTTDVKDNTSVTAARPVTAGYFYRARAWTASVYGSSVRYSTGAAGYCYLLNDPTAPIAPTITVASPFVICTPASCPPSGSVGAAASFSATNGEKYLARAEWWLYDIDHSQTALASGTAPAVNGIASFNVTPQAVGDNFLKVRLVDQWNRPSLEKTVQFKVGL